MACPTCLEANDELPALCDCKGTMAPMHRACLSEWLRHHPDEEPTCPVCRAPQRVVVQSRRVASTERPVLVFGCLFIVISFAADAIDVLDWFPTLAAAMQTLPLAAAMTWVDHHGLRRSVIPALMVRVQAMVLTATFADDECTPWVNALLVCVITLPLLALLLVPSAVARRTKPTLRVAAAASVALAWALWTRSVETFVATQLVLRSARWVVMYVDMWPRVLRVDLV